MLYKLAAYGLAYGLFNYLTDFLHDRVQRVALPIRVSNFKYDDQQIGIRLIKPSFIFNLNY